ncbi:phage capsid protein [Streptococcus bovimastitidis]|uniref:Phage capsid protein n=1 Tax=Streptococcus bovimastitidis TaxID=1856638 RepID=A0A1L8MKJ1_9STRE|nr:phage capsid protein [Streptococcus bovimastitidis]OJF71246.1 phage capsid protein [Streptococcus bovimastitidis]
MVTTRTFPEDGLIKTTDLRNPITIDVTNTFKENLNKLIEMLGITRKISVQAGATLRTYSGYEVALADGTVPEGEVIPLSKVTQKDAGTKVITLKKYRKATTGEDIQMYGSDNAIANTDEALIRKIQNNVRADFVAALKTGTGTIAPLGNGLQGGIASAWGQLEVLFEDQGSSKAIVFANPLDVAEYIANAQISTQTAFGLTYLVDFTGTVIISTNDVAKGEIWATVPENLILAYVNPNTSELAREFGLHGDSTGYIGMNHFREDTTLTIQTLVVEGLLMYPERIDGIVKVTLKAAAPTV